MRFLVTGAAGFIGFHLCRRLIDDGHEVTGFDGMTPYYDVRLKEARLKLLAAMPRFTGVTGMVEDHAALASAAERAAPDVIVHLAAQAGVRHALANARAYIDTNLTGSWNVLDVARTLKPTHLMIASTSAVYGANPAMPFVETDRTDEPLSLYAATKKGVEAMAHAYAHLYGVPTTMLRFFTVYGPWGRPDMALFRFVDAISADKPIDVYGYGKPQRDFTYIDDLVEAMTRLIAIAPDEANRVTRAGASDSLSRQGPYRVVNISGGQPVMLDALIGAVEAALGRTARRNPMPMQPGDVPVTHASPALLEALTGYRPQTPLHTGVEAFVAWYRDYRRAG
jgi:UDP-glucuronate 4-epimerase